MGITTDTPISDTIFELRLPALPGKIRIGLLLAFWTAVAVVATTVAFIAMRGGSPALWLKTFQPMILYYYSWALMSVAIYRLVSKPLNNAVDVARTVFLCLLVLGAMVFLMPFVVHGNEWRDWLYGSRAPGFQALGVIIFLFLLVGSLALKYYQQGIMRERERLLEVERAARLQGELTRARLNTLIMQVNPHFLFNALNSIGALIETEKNADAYRTTELLGALLRQTLDRSEQTTTSLSEEIAFVEKYVALEQTRFGDRLAFGRTISAGALERRVPVFILQPIIENSIKHAVSKSSRLVSVHLTVTIADTGLMLAVEDDGPGLSPAFKDRHGIGLANIRNRLELLYGRDDLLEILPGKTGGTLVTITVPT